MDELGFTDLDKELDDEVFFNDEALETDEDLVEILNETKHSSEPHGIDQDEFDDVDDDEEDDYESL
jgi:hypothetical protein